MEVESLDDLAGLRVEMTAKKFADLTVYFSTSLYSEVYFLVVTLAGAQRLRAILKAFLPQTLIRVALHLSSSKASSKASYVESDILVVS